MLDYEKEKECIKPRAGDADLWVQIWEELPGLAERHFGGSRACKGATHEQTKEHISQFERFVTEGNEKADELAKAGAMLDEGFMAEARAKTMAAGKRAGVCSFAVCGQLPLLGKTMEGCEEFKPKPKEKWIFVDKKSEETKHRTEWCAEADRYEDARNMYRTKNYCQKVSKNGEGAIWEDMTR